MYEDSFILTKELAKEAVDMALPAIEAVMKQLDRPNLHIVVLNPTISLDDVYDIEDAILYERSLGDVANWPHRYDKIARSKAEISLRTGLPSHLVQQRLPFLYIKGDTRYGGSVVFEGKLIVACSGAPWYYDQVFNNWVAAGIQGKSIQVMEQHLQSDAPDFLGDEKSKEEPEIPPGTFMSGEVEE